MKVSILGSTHPGYAIPMEDALLFSGHSAGICYLPDTVETLWNENPEKTMKRIDGNLKSGHHSVFGHVYYNLLIEDCPKILAMILNNEKIYNTSEKSARYTKMRMSEKEQVLYDKWLTIYQQRIQEEYPDFPEKKVEKLAQENARYLISVFTPATTMEYTVSLQQLNYLIYWCHDYIKNKRLLGKFEDKVAESLKDFLNSLPPDCILDNLKDYKGRGFSLFATRTRTEEFGENYSTNYLGSFTQLAQAQRHRTLNYEMSLPSKPCFYTPPIIQGTQFEEEWQKDISSLADSFPQGMLVNINERGTLENFILKCGERLCGAAQLEIAQCTRITLGHYIFDSSQDDIKSILIPISKHCTRCKFLPDFHCTPPAHSAAKNSYPETFNQRPPQAAFFLFTFSFLLYYNFYC